MLGRVQQSKAAALSAAPLHPPLGLSVLLPAREAAATEQEQFCSPGDAPASSGVPGEDVPHGEMAFCRSEPRKEWERLLLSLPLSPLQARTSHRVGRAFLKLRDHPALNEDQAVPGLMRKTLVCPSAGRRAQLSSTHPCGHHHIPACLPQDHIQPAHSLFATASGKQTPHTSTSLAAQMSWMASLGVVAGKAGPHLAALHIGGHFRRQRVLVASAPAVPQLWHSSQGFTQPSRTWAAAQLPGPMWGTQHRPQCHRAPHHVPAPAPWLAFTGAQHVCRLPRV